MRKVAIKEDICMGCGLCRVHCLTAHSSSGDMIKAWKKELPRALPRIKVERKGEVSFSLQCKHCDEPWCVYSCLSGALQKDPLTGMVTLDSQKCCGCWSCVLACPHNAIVMDIENKVAAKCDSCMDRKVPVCVANCPNEALYIVETGNGKKIDISIE